MDDFDDGDDGNGGDHGENDSDDDAPMSLKCRTSKSIQRLAQIASKLEMIQRLPDAECQKPLRCMHKLAMHQRPVNAECHNL